MLHSTRAIAIA
jgi:hypothetical protein